MKCIKVTYMVSQNYKDMPTLCKVRKNENYNLIAKADAKFQQHKNCTKYP